MEFFSSPVSVLSLLILNISCPEDISLCYTTPKFPLDQREMTLFISCCLMDVETQEVGRDL